MPQQARSLPYAAKRAVERQAKQLKRCFVALEQAAV
jgi:hypothetical protein